MRALSLWMGLTLTSISVFANDSYLVQIKASKNGVMRTHSRLITTLNQNAEIAQTSGVLITSRKLFLSESAEDSLSMSLRITEKLSDDSFVLDEKFEIRKNLGAKKLSLSIGKNVYSYEVTISPHVSSTAIAQ